MYNRYKHYKTLFSLLLLFIGAACSREADLTVEQTPSRIGLVLQLTSPLSLEVDTRATGGEVEITDVWVVQVTTADSKIVVKNYADSKITWDSSSKRYKVSTGDTDFWNENSQFYVIANAGTEHTGLKAMKTKAESIPSSATIEGDLLPLLQVFSDGAVLTEPGLLSDGPITFEQKTGSSSQIKATLVSHLQRAYAKINIQYKVTSTDFPNATFTPANLTVKNLSANLAFFERAGATSGSYPSAETGVYAGNFTESVQLYSSAGGSAVFPADTPLTFYMGENLRGAGISTTVQGKNVAANGPLEDGSGGGGTRSLKGCTAIVLTGTYKYDGSHTGEVGVTYTFYPGGNLLNDYNIERGKAYTLKINIGSVNSADLRVTVTDGNVSVFDRVTVVPEINVNI